MFTNIKGCEGGQNGVLQDAWLKRQNPHATVRC